MLANVSWSPEVNVALDTLQRSVFVSASGNAEQFSASVQCGYYHLGVPLPFQRPVPWILMSVMMVIMTFVVVLFRDAYEIVLTHVS